jgi:PIN domain nuclease of toxin-antitoxin system
MTRTRGVLLDTHTVLWLMNGDALADEALNAINEAGNATFVSPISAWEIATLVRKNRIALTTAPLRWFENMLGTGVELALLSPEVLVGSVLLPGSPPSDPADRMLIETARQEDLTLITRDRSILDYGELGHVRTARC